jgi:iron-sulfur cluster repair protein YtfE (RIC family)
MAVVGSDPVRQFEHSHGALTRLAFEIGQLLRAEGPTSAIRERLVRQLELLRDELLRHFADEEEGLFPFVRRTVPAKAEAVDRLSDAHDAICGAVVRLVHLVQHDPKAQGPDRSALLAHYERFESAYAHHSQQERALFEELGRTLDDRGRADLTEILRGL